MPECLRERHEHPEHDEQPERDEIEGAPVVSSGVVEHQLVAGRNLVEPGERDPGVRGEVHRIPGLVAQAAPDDHDGGDDHGDEQERPDGRRDHPGIDPTAEHRRDLLRQRDLVHQRVAPDGEDDVREHEVKRRVAVPAVPDAEPVEADEPLQPGQPREQEHLDQRRVGGEQPGDAGERGQQLAGGEVLGDVAAVHPEVDDRGGVARENGPEKARGQRAAGGAAALGDGERRRAPECESCFGHR